MFNSLTNLFTLSAYVLSTTLKALLVDRTLRPANYPDEGLSNTCTDITSDVPVPSAILPWANFNEEVENWVDSMVDQNGDRSVFVQSLAAPLKVFDEFGEHYHLDLELLTPVVRIFNSGTPGLLPIAVKLRSHEGGEFG